MSRDWEAQFKDWSKPPGKTEENRCENAISAIRNAINASVKLKEKNIKIIVQGSYQNNTNVRKDSDVDVGLIYKDSFFYDLPDGLTLQNLGLSESTYKFDQFKSDVEEALIKYFGQTAVKRGNKAIDIHETTYHVEADATPFFEHRRYKIDGTYIAGVELVPDNKTAHIINWPEQHYNNGCQKNKSTGNRFKSIVRILKALSIEMVEKGIGTGNIPGFLIECLVWNVDNGCFQHNTLTEDVKASLIFLYDQTKIDNPCQNWGEVSELKYLFRSSQKWTREQANAFIVAAWKYIGFGG